MEMKKKKNFLGIGIISMMLVIGFSLTGCFSTPAAQPMPQPAPQPGQYATITFANKTGETIYYLQISERTDNSWGDDWLGNDVIINGDTYTTRLLHGQYDVRASTRDYAHKYVFWITVSQSGTFNIEPSDLQR
jgi:hypothetical protein